MTDLVLGDFFYYLAGDDGVRRSIISCTVIGKGSTYARGRGDSPRVFLQGFQGWTGLSDLQKDALCHLLWSRKTGHFVILDAVTGHVLATHALARGS